MRRRRGSKRNQRVRGFHFPDCIGIWFYCSIFMGAVFDAGFVIM
jgi:hypothetical protein